MKYLKIFLLSLLISSSYTFAQEADVDAPTNLDKLLAVSYTHLRAHDTEADLV